MKYKIVRILHMLRGFQAASAKVLWTWAKHRSWYEDRCITDRWQVDLPGDNLRGSYLKASGLPSDDQYSPVDHLPSTDKYFISKQYIHKHASMEFDADFCPSPG